MTGPITVYNDAKANAWKGRFNLNASDTVKMALVLSTSNALDAALSGATYGALTHEVAAANGYTTGGVSVASPVINGGGAVATITMTSSAPTLTASGGTIVFRGVVFYDVTTGYLLAFAIADTTPADVTIADGSTETFSFASIFSLT